MAQIFYVGHAGPSTTSRHRADALTRLGHHVVLMDPYEGVRKHSGGRLAQALHYRSGYRLLQTRMLQWLTRGLDQYPAIDVVWIDGGELTGPGCLRAINARGIRSVLFNHDDPTGKRDGRRFDMLKKALRFYDATVAVREESAVDYQLLGARNVILSWRTYDEVAHRPFAGIEEIPPAFRSDVAFIGTWIAGENRDRFLLSLSQSGIPVSIWGNRWQKSPVWKELEPCWRGPGLGGRDYVAAIQGAKICLGMLSKQNRDRHTTRSLEIPFAGGLLCAERTDDHLRMYDEDREAVYWSDVTECIAKCKWLLSDGDAREKIRVAGIKKVRQNKTGSEDMCRRVLDSIGISSPSTHE